MSNDITITLTNDEAVVLFEFLSRFSETDKLTIADASEKQALWNLCCVFEKKLPEPLCANYDEILERCRSKLRD